MITQQDLENMNENRNSKGSLNAKVLDIITSASMYVIAHEKRLTVHPGSMQCSMIGVASQGPRETAVLTNVPEPAKNP